MPYKIRKAKQLPKQGQLNPDSLPGVPGNLSLTDLSKFTYPYPFSTVRNSTNIELQDSLRQLGGLASLSLASNLGIPQVSQIAGAAISTGAGSTYNAVPFTNLNRFPGVAYPDFRARKGWNANDLLGKRLDGLSASTINIRDGFNIKKRWISVAYAAASATPAGAYSVFNRDGNKYFGAGWGDHGNRFALRNDFTAQSHVATRWDNVTAKWKPVTNPLSIATPFRGDRVQVIDFGKRSLNNAYEWNPLSEAILGANDLNQTQDFIKFFLTGPKLSPNADNSINDHVIVFRAAITSLTDSFSPQWTPVNLIGRADPNYQYSSYSRALQLSFDVYATDRDEMKPIWRKLNALAGYTAPTYNPDSIALEGPWMRITIGDLFYQQPVVINSLTYTLQDAETTWEINIEQDETMMQVPKKISVTLGLNIITNELPQKEGRFYTLAKRFHETGQTLPGSDNWLSDSKINEESILAQSADSTNETTAPGDRLKFKEKIKQRIADLQRNKTTSTKIGSF